MTCETLKHLRHLSRPGDYFVSLDLTDGYYTLGIREEDRDYFTVNYRGIAPARFFLRELHNILATRTAWGGRVRLTHQLRRDLEWWRTVPNQNNGRSIYKPMETVYLHADSSDYG
jgi:hypothetical protein